MSAIRMDYVPIRVHEAMHRSTAFERLSYGGYGSAKSTAVCAELLGLMLEQPGSEALVCRKTAPALRDTTERTLVGLIPQELFKQCKVARAGGHYESVQLPNGSRFMFRALDDWRKLRSLNLAYLLIDEADEVDEESYVGLLSRIRQTQPTKEAKAQGAPKITRRGTLLACNPQGHNWIWKRWMSPDKVPGTEFWISSSLDNPHLPMSYIESLLAMPDPWVRRYVLGSPDEFGGQIYEGWTWDTHVVSPYDKYDPDGLFIMGMDPGTDLPTAAVWAYYDRKKACLVAVAEYKESGLAANVHAKEWRKIESKLGRVRRRIADPVITTRDRGSNMGLDDQYRRLGYNFELGPRRIDDRLPALGQLIHTERFKVTTDCPQLFEQIRQYRWEDLTPLQRDKGRNAAPLKRNVDLVDAAQYLASRYVVQPKVELDERDEQALHQAEIHTAIRSQIRSGKTATRNHDLGSLNV